MRHRRGGPAGRRPRCPAWHSHRADARAGAEDRAVEPLHPLREPRPDGRRVLLWRAVGDAPQRALSLFTAYDELTFCGIIVIKVELKAGIILAGPLEDDYIMPLVQSFYDALQVIAANAIGGVPVSLLYLLLLAWVLSYEANIVLM